MQVNKIEITDEQFDLLFDMLLVGCNFLTFEDFEKKFGKIFPRDIIKKTEKFIENGLMKCDEKSMALTEKGFLLSNSIIAELI